MNVETACEQRPEPGCWEGKGWGDQSGRKLLFRSLCLQDPGSPVCV